MGSYFWKHSQGDPIEVDALLGKLFQMLGYTGPIQAGGRNF